MSRFVGRERDAAALERALADGGRPVTLLGPGGIGKTRLATELLAGRDDAYFCDLTAASGPLDVCSVVAGAIGASLGAADSQTEAMQQLGEALAAKRRCTLLLDNFEHLVGSEAVVVRLATAAPEAELIVTSRTRLRVEGELVIDLGPLPHEDAMALFIDRARAVRRDYEPSDADRKSIAAICEALDGIPLALELAAARLRVLSPEQLATRLERRLDVLTDSPRGAPRRHSTLRATLDWSWDLLSEEERRALSQCAAFAGGFDVEAAEAVLRPGGDASILDVVSGLRDHSLLDSHDHPGSGRLRFRMFESVREYAAEKLDESGDRAEVEKRHAQHYTTLGLTLAERVERRHESRAWAILAAEHENLLVVHRRGLAAGRLADALGACLSMQPLLLRRGPAELRLSMLNEALDALPTDGSIPVPETVVGWVLLARGEALTRMGRLDEGQADFQRGIAIAERADDLRLLGRHRWRLGALQATREDYGAAIESLREARSIHEGTGDRFHEGRCLSSLGGVLLEAGDLAEAKRSYDLAIDAHRETSDLDWEGTSLAGVGRLLHLAGDAAGARSTFERAIEVLSLRGHARFEARALTGLASLRREEGELPTALALAQRARERTTQAGDRRAEGFLRVEIGACHEENGDPVEARQHYLAALRIEAGLRSPRLAILGHAMLAALESSQGSTEAARNSLERAREIAAARPDEPVGPLVEIVAGQLALDAGEAEVAQKKLEEAEARQLTTIWERHARRRLRVAFEGGVPEGACVVGIEATWFTPPGGEKTDIETRKAPRLILRRLVDVRLAEPGRTLTVDELFEAGWPGEHASPDSAASRVYVAVSTLRKMGLKDMLLRNDEGYFLDPAVPVIRAES